MFRRLPVGDQTRFAGAHYRLVQALRLLGCGGEGVGELPGVVAFDGAGVQLAEDRAQCRSGEFVADAVAGVAVDGVGTNGKVVQECAGLVYGFVGVGAPQRFQAGVFGSSRVVGDTVPVSADGVAQG